MGPDLSAIGKARPRAELLESMLEPSRRIEPKYATCLVRTARGLSDSGLLTRRNEVVLRDAENRGDRPRVPVDAERGGVTERESGSLQAVGGEQPGHRRAQHPVPEGAGRRRARAAMEGREAVPRQHASEQEPFNGHPRRFNLTLEGGIYLAIHGDGKPPAARGDRVRITGTFTYTQNSFVRYRLAVARVEKLPAKK